MKQKNLNRLITSKDIQSVNKQTNKKTQHIQIQDQRASLVNSTKHSNKN